MKGDKKTEEDMHRTGREGTWDMDTDIPEPDLNRRLWSCQRPRYSRAYPKLPRTQRIPVRPLRRRRRHGWGDKRKKAATANLTDEQVYGSAEAVS